MKPEQLTKVLVFSCFFFVTADIVLALCLGLVLPNYIMRFNWYYAGGEEMTFREAAAQCGCLYNQFPNGTSRLIKLIKVNESDLVPRTEVPDLREKFPILVSVHVNVTRGGKDPRNGEFVCAGALTADDLVHLAEECVYEVSHMWMLRYGNFQGQGIIVYPQWSGFCNNPIGHNSRTRIIKVLPTYYYRLIGWNVHFQGKFKYLYVIGWHDRHVGHKYTEEVWTTVGMPTHYAEVCSTYSSKYSFIKIAVTPCKGIVEYTGFSEQTLCMKYRIRKFYGNIPEKDLICNE